MNEEMRSIEREELFCKIYADGLFLNNSTNENLDRLGIMHGIYRKDHEKDADYRTRIKEAMGIQREREV